MLKIYQHYFKVSTSNDSFALDTFIQKYIYVFYKIMLASLSAFLSKTFIFIIMHNFYSHGMTSRHIFSWTANQPQYHELCLYKVYLWRYFIMHVAFCFPRTERGLKGRKKKGTNFRKLFCLTACHGGILFPF